MTRAALSKLVPATFIAACAALFGTAPASAQDAPPPATTATADTQLETIEVTGSRIRQVDLETAQPVVFITREDIEKQGFTGIADILQNLSAAGSPALSRASPLSAGENVGGSFISLRGLGATRTLVLVNGKRLGISTSGFQDISVIPLAMVERIEVLKDGASALYGSDAMGGVVNIITRTKTAGVQAAAYYGVYDEGDGQIDRYDFVIGSQGPKGGLVFGLEYENDEVVYARNRDFSSTPQGELHPTRNWTVVGQYGGFVATPTTPGYIGCTPTGATACPRILPDPDNPTTDPRDINDYIRQNVDSGSAVGSTLHKSNTNQQTDLRTPLQRKSLFFGANYDVADNMEFVMDLAYTDRQSSRTVAGYPYQALTFSTPMSIDSYYNPLGNQSSAPTKQAISSWWRRAWEVPRVSVSDLDTLRGTGGFRGAFQWLDRRFDWDSMYMYSSNNVVQSSYGNLNIANVQRAVGPSFLNGTTGQVLCGAPGAIITGCVPWNPFVPFGTVASGGLTNNEALMEYLFQEEHSTGRTTTNIMAVSMGTTIIALPAGDLAFAAGIERREEVGGFTPDALAVTAGSTNLAARSTFGGYDASEIWGETKIPLVRDVPAVHDLNLQLAMRYSDYSTFGGVKRGKAGLEYRPISELMFRGTYSEGFRVPTISNLYAGGSQTFAFYTDPCDPVYGQAQSSQAVRDRCAQDISNYGSFRQLQQGFVPASGTNAQTPVPFYSGAGNPELEPESSYSQTIGMVWSSSWLTGYSMSVDYWKIDINNTIVADTPTQILGDCYVQQIQSRCSSALFTRDPTLGYVNTMNYGSRNAGYIDTEGWDFDVRYAFKIWRLPEAGSFVFNWQNTYLSKQAFKTTNDPTVIEAPAVTFASSAGTTHRLRSNANLNWTIGPFGATWGARYYSQLRESCLNRALFPDECSEAGYIDQRGINVAQNRNGSNTFHDVQFRYNTPWNGLFSLGANNVFEHLGQQMYSQPNANVSYNGEFDIGRFIYAKYLHRF